MKTIKILNEDRIERVDKCISEIRKDIPDRGAKLDEVKYYPGELILYHYTSIEKLFGILNGDSMWASHSRFSNDASEGEALGQQWIEETQYYGDNFVLCFCNQDDILSQWRGYCPNGGASIGFWFPPGYSTFTLLHANCKEGDLLPGADVEAYKNRPIPVIYYSPEGVKKKNTDIAREDILNYFNAPSIKATCASLRDIAPYLKNSFYMEEREFRIVFDNANRVLEDCIRFRTMKDGSMVPYIVVKFGNLLEAGRKLKLSYTDDAIDDLVTHNIKALSRKATVIPCGQDQTQICDKLSQKIRDYEREIYSNNTAKWAQWKQSPATIICDGHLPVVSITVSPSPRQAYIKEVIERFCRSRYWLRYVTVKCSEIPYVSPQL